MSDLTKEAVEAKLGKSPSGSSTLSTLESYVGVQVESACAGSLTDTYSLLANRTLLKIYQYQPKKSDPCMASTILLLSLISSFSTTGTDVQSLVYLLPERIVRADPCSAVLKCCRLMDGCDFVEFWRVFRGMPTSVSAAASSSSEDGMKVGDPAMVLKLVQSDDVLKQLRTSILQVLALTYKSAPADKVVAALDLTSVDEISKLGCPCVESVDTNANTVVFVATADNTKRERVYQEGLSFVDISEMMSKVVSAE